MKILQNAVLLAMMGYAAGAAAAGNVSANIEATPTAAETAAIKRALGSEYAGQVPFKVGHVDLNGDKRPDLLFRTDNSDFCGSHGCATHALLATPSGYSRKSIDLAISFGDVIVLPPTHKGMHDLRFSDGTHRFRWNGSNYS